LSGAQTAARPVLAVKSFADAPWHQSAFARLQTALTCTARIARHSLDSYRPTPFLVS